MSGSDPPKWAHEMRLVRDEEERVGGDLEVNNKAESESVCLCLCLDSLVAARWV